MSWKISIRSALAVAVLGGAGWAQEPAPAGADGGKEKLPIPEEMRTEEFWAKQLEKPMQSQEFPPGPSMKPAEDVGKQWEIHWEFQAITLPAKAGRRLLPELRDETTMAVGWEKVRVLISKEEAMVVLNVDGKTVTGRGAKYAEVEEVQYPREFERAEILEGAATVVSARRGKPGATLGIGAGAGFDVARKIGIVLSLEAAVTEDGQRLRVDTEIAHTWFLGWEDFEVGRLANNERIVFQQPRFAKVERKSTHGLMAGERVLLSAHPVPGVKETTELLLLRVWTTPRGGTK